MKDFKHLKQSELNILYYNFRKYRDSSNDSSNDISVQEFYIKYGLESHVEKEHPNQGILF